MRIHAFQDDVLTWLAEKADVGHTHPLSDIDDIADAVVSAIEDYFAGNPVTISWGNITGTLSNQTDLGAQLSLRPTTAQAALLTILLC